MIFPRSGPIACWLRGHSWSILCLEHGRAWLECASCGAATKGWDIPSKVGDLRRAGLTMVQFPEAADVRKPVTHD